MKRFAQLFTELDQTTRTSEKVSALESYFNESPSEDAAWALHFLVGKRGRRPIKTTLMREWIAEASGFPEWLVAECYDTVGDLAETLSLLMNAGNDESDSNRTSSISFSELIQSRIIPLADAGEAGQRQLLITTLQSLSRTEGFLFLKLLTGGFRMGVSKTLVVRALAKVAGLSPAVIQHRLMGRWEPTAEDLQRLLSSSESERDPAQPYPFYLASPIEQNVDPITDLSHWQVEWKWDGIRAQLIRRDGQTILWSRGEEVITPAFPEIEQTSQALADGTVLDGELLAWRDELPLSFNELQKRLGRKTVSKRIQTATPVVFMAYDLLENNGDDLRMVPLSDRRKSLEQTIEDAGCRFEEISAQLFPSEEVQGELFELDDPNAEGRHSPRPNETNGGKNIGVSIDRNPALTLNPSPPGEGGAIEPHREPVDTNLSGPPTPSSPFGHPLSPGERVGVKATAPTIPPPSSTSTHTRFALRLSPLVQSDSMDELAALQQSAREMRAEGVMLKRRDSVYGVGRERGYWWKWKVDPYTIDAVMIAAQPGHGKRAGLFTDYTFGIWKGDELLSLAKAYSGLTDEEIQQVDKWVRENTTGRHGPVRTVKPELVFELAFEGIQESKRHKSGFALRFPRIARWRHDKPAKEADRIEVLEALAHENRK